MMARVSFWSAVLGGLVLVIYAAAGGAAWPGYNHLTQYLSELGAVGAPHHELISWGGFFLFGALIIVFALTAFLSLPKSTASFLGFLGIAWYAAGSVAAAFFPCDAGCRPEEPSFSQEMHNLFGGTGYLAGVIALFILAGAARHWEGGKNLDLLGVVCGIAGVIGFLGLDPSFTYLGAAQRLLEAGMNVWILACAFYVRSR